MAKSKAAPLGASLLVRKGEATPAKSETKTAQPSEASLPRGTKDTVAVTVRLDEARYHRLIEYGARFTPRRTNQEILVEALDAYLKNK
jgi:hypothetical protein